MKFVSMLREWLYDPRVRGVDVDDIELLDIHMKILKEKPLLRSAFETFYSDMLDLCARLLKVSGTEVELGSGAGFFKSLHPQLVTSDIRRGQHIDMVLDAQDMSFPDDSVRCIYAINVFHHLPDPDRFFEELSRVLRVGGGCILIEPHNGFGSALVHRHLHSDESFEPDAIDWRTSEIEGPLSGANQALSYIVFERDIQRFQATYGNRLEIVHHGYVLNGVRYLMSGGLNFRQLLPTAFDAILRGLEKIGGPLARYWSLHHVIVIRRHT